MSRMIRFGDVWTFDYLERRQIQLQFRKALATPTGCEDDPPRTADAPLALAEIVADFVPLVWEEQETPSKPS